MFWSSKLFEHKFARLSVQEGQLITNDILRKESHSQSGWPRQSPWGPFLLNSCKQQNFMTHFLSLEIILGTVIEGLWSCTCCSISPVDLIFCRCSTRELWRLLILAPWAFTWSVSTLTYVCLKREFTQHGTYPASPHAVTASFHHLFRLVFYHLLTMTGARTNVTFQYSFTLYAHVSATAQKLKTWQ